MQLTGADQPRIRSRTYSMLLLVLSSCCCIVNARLSAEITALSHAQYFKTNVCYGEKHALNIKFARGIDLWANANKPAEFFDHMATDYKELEQENYLIGKKLGSGKFSDVFLGYDKTQNMKKVVIKILRPNKIAKIYREISLLQKADPIENIAHLLGVVTDPTYSVPSLVFEFMSGKTLRMVMKRFNEIDIRYYGYLLLEALQETHALGLIHRDIKGGNIIVDHEERKLKLIDFGLSEVYDPADIIFSKIGTIGYKAPEMLIRDGLYQHFSPAIDIWAAGMCIFGMMVNKLPFMPSKPDQALLRIIEIFGYEGIFKLSSELGVSLKSSIYHTIQEYPEKYSAKGIGLTSLIKQSDEQYAPDIGIEFLSKLFNLDPSERISAAEALEHPYFDPVRSIIQAEKKSKDSKQN